MNRIVILHSFIPPDAPPDEQDVLLERDEIAASLARLGYEPVALPITLNLEEANKKLLEIKPVKVFNIVESLGGHDRLLFLAPALLDALSIPYTGSSTTAIIKTTDKLGAKRVMRERGLPTPHFMEPGEAAPEEGPFIVKSSWDHASIGLDESSVISLQKGDHTWHKAFSRRFKTEYFAERFVDGREFNIALLQGPDGPEMLPPAEMCFKDYPEEKLKIVDYKSKWDENSFEYNHTVRSFELSDRDAPLIEKLRTLSLACWHLFGLRGYARVDFRVDSRGNPLILEVNVNPCLSSDAGFIAAAAHGGLSFDAVIQRIIGDLPE